MPLEKLIEFMIGGDWGKGEDAPADWKEVSVMRGTEYRNWSVSRASTSALRRVKAKSLETRGLQQGDIVLEVSGGGPDQPVGRTVVIDKAALKSAVAPLICSNFCRLVRLKAGVSPEFVNSVLRLKWSFGEFNRYQNETVNIRNLNVPDFVAGTEIPLPPLPEQKRIVEAMERLATRIDAARERLASVPAILKQFRQAVLAAACSGRLTEDWREASGSKAGIRELLRTTDANRAKAGRVPRVDGVPEDMEAPDGWSPVYFGNLLTLLTSGSRGWAEFYSKTGPLFIRSQDINTDRLVLTDMAHVTPPTKSADRARTRATRDDVLLTITGANVTKCAHVSADIPEAYVSQHVALCRLAIPELSPFIHVWLTSPQHGRKVLLDNAYGAGKPGLNLDNIKEVPIALPPLAEQTEIVRRVNSLMRLADAIERRVTLGQARADKLTQSVLAKAFRGELVSAVVATVPASVGLAQHSGATWTIAELAAIQTEIVRRETTNPTLGRKKLYKLGYLTAAVAGARLQPPPKQMAAGPFNREAQAEVESLASTEKWFHEQQATGTQREAGYRPGAKAAKAYDRARELLGDHWKPFERLLGVAAKWDSDAAELHATVHAAWNDLIAGNQPADNEAIARRFYDWSTEKTKFSKFSVTDAIRTLERLNLRPTGTGPLIAGAGEAKLF